MSKFKTKRNFKKSDVTKLKELEKQLQINADVVDSPFQDIKCQSSEIDINTIENNILRKRFENGVTPDEGDIVMCKKYYYGICRGK